MYLKIFLNYYNVKQFINYSLNEFIPCIFQTPVYEYRDQNKLCYWHPLILKTDFKLVKNKPISFILMTLEDDGTVVKEYTISDIEKYSILEELELFKNEIIAVPYAIQVKYKQAIFKY